jgi:molybdopterin/thiamine biosynthesis adenylyltransferase
MNSALTQEERAIYEWQMWVDGFGEVGQEKLKSASVLISRLGGVGGNVAWQLAAAGIGKLVLAHGGNVKESDLNRQILMTYDHLGKPRMESIVSRLKAFNPRLEIIARAQNIDESNAAELVAQADILVDCAPLFEERYLMNREAVRQGKPMVESAMYDMELHLTTFVPGRTPCLTCLYPEKSKVWKRQFPVFGAVAGVAGCLSAVEVIKMLSGLGNPLTNRLLTMDLRFMTHRTFNLQRDPTCPVCGSSLPTQDNGSRRSYQHNPQNVNFTLEGDQSGSSQQHSRKVPGDLR